MGLPALPDVPKIIRQHCNRIAVLGPPGLAPRSNDSTLSVPSPLPGVALVTEYDSVASTIER